MELFPLTEWRVHPELSALLLPKLFQLFEGGVGVAGARAVVAILSGFFGGRLAVGVLAVRGAFGVWVVLLP